MKTAKQFLIQCSSEITIAKPVCLRHITGFVIEMIFIIHMFNKTKARSIYMLFNYINPLLYKPFFINEDIRNLFVYIVNLYIFILII